MPPVYICSDHRCPVDEEHFTLDQVTFHISTRMPLSLCVYSTVPTFVCAFNLIVWWGWNLYILIGTPLQVKQACVAHSTAIHAR